MSASAGIHHVTAICRDPADNVAFYAGNLGLRMVKRTVNFDDPGSWHLYYGDEIGRPGTALTFFAWGEQPAGRNGNGMAAETAFVIPESSLGYWTQRLIERGIAHDAPEKRFGERVLPFRDADGMRLALVAVKGADQIPGWSNGDVPAQHALRGFRGVTLMVGAGEPTAEVLTAAFGFHAQGREGQVVRYRAGGDNLGAVVDVRTAEGFLAGRQGTGSVHHVAFRAATDAAQAEMVATLKAQGLHPDRPDRSLLFPLRLFSRAGRRLVRDRHGRPGLHRGRAEGNVGGGDQASAVARVPAGPRSSRRCPLWASAGAAKRRFPLVARLQDSFPARTSQHAIVLRLRAGKE